MKNSKTSFNFRSLKIAAIAILLFLLSSSGAFSFDYKSYRTATAPVIDGIGDELCWRGAQWASINQPFDGKTLPDSSDFYGRYKIVWTSSRLYVLMEITDDKLIDNRVNPSDNYWEDDCTEFFIDEDHKPEGHECSTDAFNAFAYHIAAVARDKANYTNGSILNFDSPNAINHVIDLGNDCNTGKALDFDDHVKVKLSKSGSKYTWELEFKIFDKNYSTSSTVNSPVTLTANKVMGFAIAYCDDDNGRRENMIGTIPNHNDYSGKYPFYRFTNEFGTLTLIDSVQSTTGLIDKNSSPENEILWPNPVDNFLYIKPISNIRIITLSGLTLISQRTENRNAPIDVSRIPSGIYILEATYKSGKYQQKFLKR